MQSVNGHRFCCVTKGIVRVSSVRACLATVFCVASLAAGCRTDPRIHSLEMESFHQEELKDLAEADRDKAKQALETCQKENVALKEQLRVLNASGGSGSASLVPETPLRATQEKAKPENDLRLPEIEGVPQLPSPSGSPAPTPRGAAPREGSPRDKAAERTGVYLQGAQYVKADNHEVRQITLNRFLTAGLAADRAGRQRYRRGNRAS